MLGQEARPPACSSVGMRQSGCFNNYRVSRRRRRSQQECGPSRWTAQVDKSATEAEVTGRQPDVEASRQEIEPVAEATGRSMRSSNNGAASLLGRIPSGRGSSWTEKMIQVARSAATAEDTGRQPDVEAIRQEIETVADASASSMRRSCNPQGTTHSESSRVHMEFQ